MGGIKQHGKGIQITFYWNGERYRPTLKIPSTPANIIYATRLKAEIERAIGLGTYTLEQYAKHFPTTRVAQSLAPEQPPQTFRDVAELWIKASTHLSNGTLIKYKQALNFWLEHLGDKPIATIQYSNIAALANAQGWKAKNRNNILIPLRRVMETAFLDGTIATNPALRIKNSKVQKEPPDPLSAEDVELFLLHTQKYDEQITNYFEFALFAGLRPSEQIALKWEDIDFKNSLVRVKRARTFGQEHETKTYIIRDVELNKRALAALNRQKQFTFTKDSYIFENPMTGEPFPEERPLRRAYWNPSLKELGLRKRTFYQTRHTFATLNLMAGANPMWVAKQLGHANMQMLLTVYSKWISGADKSQERNKIDTMFEGF